MTDTPDRPGDQQGPGDPAGYGEHPPYPQQGGYPQAGWGQQPDWGQQPGHVPPSQAPRPGIVALAPISGPGMLTGTLRYIRSHWLVILVPSALAMLVLTVAQVLLQFRITATIAAAQGGDPTVQFGSGFLADVIWFGGVVLVLSLVLYPLVLSILYAVLVPAVLGRAVPFGQALREGLRRAPAMLGLYVVVTLIGVAVVGLGFGAAFLIGVAGDGSGIAILAAVLVGIAGYAVSIWIWVMLMLAPPAMVTEGIGVGAGLARSRALVRGAWWRSFGIVLLGAVAAAAVSMLVAIPTSIVGAGSLTPATVASSPGVPSASTFGSYFLINGIGSWIVGSIALPFGAGLLGLVYVDRRMRTEGYARELAAQAGVPGDRRGPTGPGTST